MTIFVVVLCASAFTGLLVLASTAGPTAPWHFDPIDPAAPARGLERAARRQPWLRRVARRIVHGKGGRRSAGAAALVGAALVVIAMAIVLGSLFEMINNSTGLARLDRSVATWGAAHASGAALTVAKVVTQLGARVVTIAVLAVVVGVDLYRRRHTDVVFLALAIGIGEPLITNTVKLLVRRDRPDVPHLVNAAGFSFPSGHSAAAAAVWATAALVLGANQPRVRRALLGAAAATIATAVAATRALLGVHWLTDVLGGLAIGWGWYLVVAILFGGRRERLGTPIERVARPMQTDPP